jgi:membrane-associated phospholipid phosphatase
MSAYCPTCPDPARPATLEAAPAAGPARLLRSWTLPRRRPGGEWLLAPSSSAEHRLRYSLQIVAGSFGLYLTALLSSDQQVTDVERRLFVVMNGLPDAFSPVLFAAMQAGALVAVFICGLFALFAGRPRLAGLIVLAGGSAWVLAKFVKRVVERGRPVDYLPDVLIRGAEQMGQGFPSGHAAVAAAMATVVTPYLSTRGRVVVWLIVALVALARVYTGAHLPYDVVAGVFVGWITGSAICLMTGGWAAPRPQAGRVGTRWLPGE